MKIFENCVADQFENKINLIILKKKTIIIKSLFL